MAVSPVFQYTDTETLDAVINRLTVAGFGGGGFSMTVYGTRSLPSGSITGAPLQETISNDDDLDENLTGDLMDAFNAAEAELSTGISASQLRDLLLRIAQIGVENKALNT